MGKVRLSQLQAALLTVFHHKTLVQSTYLKQEALDLAYLLSSKRQNNNSNASKPINCISEPVHITAATSRGNCTSPKAKDICSVATVTTCSHLHFMHADSCSQVRPFDGLEDACQAPSPLVPFKLAVQSHIACMTAGDMRFC